uniref:Transthyretin/hydroxyisourate hydrolase domain-containing protein n=1 Tax=Gopherus evgoodei TaxID=1825980 RepID=A0A8C4WCL3_9SAUR
MECRAGLSALHSALRALPVYQSAETLLPCCPHQRSPRVVGTAVGQGNGHRALGARSEGPRLAPSSSLTIHVLNTLMSQPATGLATHLSQLEGPRLQWMELMKSSTNVDGHCPLFLAPGQVKLGYTSFYPYVEAVFMVTEQTRQLHIPLLISPFSYTTYKGSKSTRESKSAPAAGLAMAPEMGWRK